MQAIEATTGKPVAKNGSAKCPAHDDRRDSLSVSEGAAGRVLLHCHAGCSFEDIIAALSVDVGDAFSGETKKAKSRITAAYDYTDENGIVLFQAVRFEPKKFRQRKPDGRGGWDWRLNGVRRVLFRLPRVLEASTGGRVVFIVEGEKDVENLEHIGLTATTNPGGAKKWRDEYSASLTGAHVVILPDNDEPGRQNAEQIARSVSGKAASVRILELPGLPEKGDVSDWIATGRTQDDLTRLASETPLFESVSSAKVGSPESVIDSFWNEIDEKNGDKKITIDQSQLVDWLEVQGVAKIFEFDKDVSTLVRRSGMTLARFPEERIRILVDEHLRDQNDKRPLAAMRRGVRVYLGIDKLRQVKELKPVFRQDTEKEAYLYYRNGFVTVTPDYIELKPYRDQSGFIWNDWIIDRDIDLNAGPKNPFECDFGHLLWLVSGSHKERVETLTSSIGYLLHDYKNSAQARAIVFTDEEVSDDPSGGTGKGLCANALKYLSASIEIDARRLDVDSRFAYQNISPGVTRIVHFNDAGRRFYFDRLYAAITDAITVERKGQQPTIVPFSESPKFVITTNEVLRGRGVSHERRIFEIEFAPYFNQEYTPEDEFRRRLFDDWDTDEWNRFDLLMLHALQYFLRVGLQPYAPVNLHLKKFARNTCPDFADFVEGFDFEANQPGAPKQKRYDKHGLINTYVEQCHQDVSAHKFTTWLKAYADFRGWELVNHLGADKKMIAFIEHGAK